MQMDTDMTTETQNQSYRGRQKQSVKGRNIEKNTGKIDERQTHPRVQATKSEILL